MASTFTPTTLDLSNEKEWGLAIGMLDWDSTSIVFTKRSLLDFLKLAGVTVDQNFSNVQKLPRYAKFGKLTAGAAAPIASNTTTTAASSAKDAAPSEDDTDEFKPTRRVRTVPGGPHSDIFAGGAQEDEETTEIEQRKAAAAIDAEDVSGIKFSSPVIPSRRVRTNPGGASSMGNLWDEPGGDDAFKPTRRVREIPGGSDHVDGIF